MNSKQRLLQALSLVGIIVGAAVLGWLNESSQLKPSATAEQLQHLPQQQSYGLDSSQFDTHGRLKYQLRATSATHYPQQGRTDLELPHAIYFPKNAEAHWEVEANLGILNNTSDQLELSEGVVLRKRSKAPTHPTLAKGQLTLRTDILRLQPERQYLETDQPVTITQENNRISAVGMVADLENGNVQLLKSVKSRYEKP